MRGGNVIARKREKEGIRIRKRMEGKICLVSIKEEGE